MPDLVIIRARTQPNATIVRPGTTVHFFFDVKNQGNAPAQGFIRVFGPGNFSDGFPGPLNPGETKVARVDYPLFGKGATYKMGFKVNAKQTIKESNYNNNHSQQFIIKTTY